MRCSQKIKRKCPNCGSHDVAQWPMYTMAQKSGECWTCGTWWPWQWGNPKLAPKKKLTWWKKFTMTLRRWATGGKISPHGGSK